MNKIPAYLLLLAAVLFLFPSCKKTAGEGGNSSIYGTVWTEDWNSSFTVKNGEYPAADVDVYIIYGDNVSPDDKVETNYNGEFEFKYLRTGNYKIYVYSKDKSLQAPSGEISVVNDVTIGSKKQKVFVDKITIYN